MTLASNEHAMIIRTERGLTIAGTRTSLYSILDFLHAQYPSRLIRDKLNLTDNQMKAALSYIEANQAEVEAEYQEILQTRNEIYQYWEERNREHFAQLATQPPKLGQENLWAKLEQQKVDRASIKV